MSDQNNLESDKINIKTIYSMIMVINQRLDKIESLLKLETYEKDDLLESIEDEELDNEINCIETKSQLTDTSDDLVLDESYDSDTKIIEKKEIIGDKKILLTPALLEMANMELMKYKVDIDLHDDSFNQQIHNDPLVDT